MKKFDETEHLIKTHHPDWDENKAHEMGGELSMRAADATGGDSDPEDPVYRKSWNESGKKLGIHPKLVDFKLHDKVFDS